MSNNFETGDTVNTYRFSPTLVKSLSTIGCRVEDVIDENKTKSVMNAYKCKSELLRNESRDNLATPAHIRIYSHSPMKYQPEGKYTHVPGAIITPITPSKSSTQLTIKSPTKRTSHHHTTNSVHHKLSSVESFPDTYKKKFDENSVDVSGNYHADPRKAINLLKSTSSAALNIPGRAADFASEVNWRMQLRN